MTNQHLGPAAKTTAFVKVGSPPTAEKPLAALLQPHIPAALADIALVDAATCAAVGAASISWWHDEVREGRAPQPAFREPRFTRWKLLDVRAFWLARIAQAAASSEVAATVTRARVASAAAQARRRAQAGGTDAAG